MKKSRLLDLMENAMPVPAIATDLKGTGKLASTWNKKKNNTQHHKSAWSELKDQFKAGVKNVANYKSPKPTRQSTRQPKHGLRPGTYKIIPHNGGASSTSKMLHVSAKGSTSIR